MSETTPMTKTRVSSQRIIGITMLVTMTFAWWWSDASLTRDRTVLLATIVFVAFGFVLSGLFVTAVRCARLAYKKAEGRWDFHIGWFALALSVLGFAGLIVWVLSGTGPVGLDQLPWLKLPQNIISAGWQYGVIYMFALMIAFIPGSPVSNAHESGSRPVSHTASHGEGGTDILGGMMR